jgi:16S rRNA (cytosine967-C5)-methyltransferase
MDVKRGKQVLDCCAAPGGKTCYLAELMAGTGRVQAWDVHEHRTALIEAQARRLGLENVRPMVRDATKKREDLYQSMDAVLLDAPCTGLGMITEKPDIKLRVTEESLRELTQIQKTLLDSVCEYVKPGGILVYSTCSVLPEENEMQAEAFLQVHPEFQAVDLPETVPEKYRQYRKTGLQLLEYRDGVEGFYVCRFRRNRG